MNEHANNRLSVRAAEAVLIAGIAAMMLFPLAGMFFGFRASGALGEKRMLKEWPAWPHDRTAIRQWPRDVEAFATISLALFFGLEIDHLIDPGSVTKKTLGEALALLYQNARWSADTAT